MSAQPLADSWFVAPEFPLKAIDSCGNELPAAYIPECDRTLGSDTRACECAGLKKVDYVAVKGTRMCDHRFLYFLATLWCRLVASDAQAPTHMICILCLNAY